MNDLATRLRSDCVSRQDLDEAASYIDQADTDSTIQDQVVEEMQQKIDQLEADLEEWKAAVNQTVPLERYNTLEAQLATVTEDRDVFRDNLERFMVKFKDLTTHLSTVTGDRDRLHARGEKYARHLSDCDIHQCNEEFRKCTCGLTPSEKK